MHHPGHALGLDIAFEATGLQQVEGFGIAAGVVGGFELVGGGRGGGNGQYGRSDQSMDGHDGLPDVLDLRRRTAVHERTVGGAWHPGSRLLGAPEPEYSTVSAGPGEVFAGPGA